MTYRQLTQDEEKLEEKVKSMWEAFLFQVFTVFYFYLLLLSVM